MSKNKKIKKSIFGPKSILVLLTLLLINTALVSYAEDSNYYDVSDSTRPPSAFSICCCSKENDDGIRVIYTCKYIEDEKCPVNSKQYKNAIGECPGNLIFTKYTPEQNQDSKDN